MTVQELISTLYTLDRNLEVAVYDSYNKNAQQIVYVYKDTKEPLDDTEVVFIESGQLL